MATGSLTPTLSLVPNPEEKEKGWSRRAKGEAIPGEEQAQRPRGRKQVDVAKDEKGSWIEAAKRRKRRATENEVEEADGGRS